MGGTPSIKLLQKSSNESLELRTVKVDTLKEPKTQVTKAKIPNVVPVRTTSFLIVCRWAIAPIAIRAYPITPSHWLSKKKKSLDRSSELKTLSIPTVINPQAATWMNTGLSLIVPSVVQIVCGINRSLFESNECVLEALATLHCS